MEKIIVQSNYIDIVKESFHSYTVISGEGIIKANNEQINLKEEETIYISKGTEYVP